MTDKESFPVIFGYARVSSADQDLTRQYRQLREHVPNERNIFADKASGKDFERREYVRLTGADGGTPIIRRGDLLVICSLDRLGRNYTQIRDEWERLTQHIGADIQVLDMPLLDTRAAENTLDRRFIADLVLQILSYTSEKERQNIRKRQRQGIDSMERDENGKHISRKTGRTAGRPSARYPENWHECYTEWKAGSVTAVEAMKRLNLKRTTFYKLVNRYEHEQP